ncbi:hypothetical protein B6D60_05905 [candidate division KSB1 bacterium 4484_87]|nr:MAG: hypothetical protein B6D60_05905 [candidate division KSB1 bacterium 4484_87]
MSDHSNEHKGFFWAILLIIIGFLFLFQNLGYLDVGNVISKFWPVILIVWGISLILKRSMVATEVQPPVKKPNPQSTINLSDDKISYSKTFGDLNIKLDSKNFQGGNIHNTFGEIYLNLQDIELNEGESKLFVNGVFGDIHINLPKNIAYKVEGSITGGSITFLNEKVDGFSKQLIHQTDDFKTATKKLKIVISLTFGDVAVW